jgi:hypothetical protein
MIKVAAVDPGTKNGAAWVGSYCPETGKVRTYAMMLGSPEESTETVQKKTKKPAYTIASEIAMWVADKCEENDVTDALVETAPRWNIETRICAAATYGVLVGRRIKNVKYSSPTTKHSAVAKFAEVLGIQADIEEIPSTLNRLDKKDSSKARLINKRNAVRVVKKLLEFSEDVEGLKVLESNKKLDDLSDALLLACGMAMKLEPKPKKAKPTPGVRRVRRIKKTVSDDTPPK